MTTSSREGGVGGGEELRGLTPEEARLIQARRTLIAKGVPKERADELAQRVAEANVQGTPLRGGFVKLTDEIMEAAFELLDEGLTPQEMRRELKLRPSDAVRVVNEWRKLQTLNTEEKRREEAASDNLIEEYRKAFNEAQRIRMQQQALRDAGIITSNPNNTSSGGGTPQTVDNATLLMLLMMQNQQRPQEKQLSPVELLTALADLQTKLRGKETTFEDTLRLIESVFNLKEKITPQRETVSIPIQPTGKTLAELIGEKVGDRIEKTIIEDVAQRIEDLVTRKPEAIKEPTFQDQIKSILQALDESRVGQRITDDLIPAIAEYVQQKVVANNTSGYRVPPRTEPPPEAPFEANVNMDTDMNTGYPIPTPISTNNPTTTTTVPATADAEYPERTPEPPPHEEE